MMYQLSVPKTADLSKEDAKRINFCGVYVLYDGLGKPLYVGQSRSVPSRVDHHRAKKRWGKQIASVQWAFEPDEGQRLVWEALLILTLRPRHNRHISLGIRKDGSLYEQGFLRKASDE